MADAYIHTFGKRRVADCISVAFEPCIWCSVVFNIFIYKTVFTNLACRAVNEFSCVCPLTFQGIGS